MHTIVFLCFANICRSPMAHAIFEAEAGRRGLVVEVFSAGVSPGFQGTMAAIEARLTCEHHGTPMSKLRAEHVSSIDLADVTRVFAMESEHFAALLAESTSLASARLSLLGDFDPLRRGAEIEDPIGQDAAAFERCYLRLRDCIIGYLDVTDDFDAPSV